MAKPKFCIGQPVRPTLDTPLSVLRVSGLERNGIYTVVEVSIHPDWGYAIVVKDITTGEEKPIPFSERLFDHITVQ